MLSHGRKLFSKVNINVIFTSEFYEIMQHISNFLNTRKEVFSPDLAGKFVSILLEILKIREQFSKTASNEVAT
jgi:hypothetical protein